MCIPGYNHLMRDHLPPLMIALAASIVATCMYFFGGQRGGNQCSLRHNPLGINFPLFVGIGATILYCLRQPQILICIALWFLLVHAMRCLPPIRRRQLHLWVVDGPITHFMHMLAKAAYNTRMAWVPAFTMAGMHVPIYLVAKGITTWYESMVFSIAKLIVDPAVGVFALAAFTTWRLLERNARWCWRRMRVFLFREALFIGRRVVWNSISIPFRNFYRELIYLWRTVHADRRTAIM